MLCTYQENFQSGSPFQASWACGGKPHQAAFIVVFFRFNYGKEGDIPPETLNTPHTYEYCFFHRKNFLRVLVEVKKYLVNGGNPR